MDLEKFDEFKEDFALFIEAGFVAVKQLDEMSATRIFQAAQALNPTHTAPRLGMAYIALNKMELKQAMKLYEEILREEPDNYLAQTFLGICNLLTKGKQAKGEKLIHEAAEKSTDPTVKNLAHTAIEWAGKDLMKKSKAPFFVGQPEDEEEAEDKGKDKK